MKLVIASETECGFWSNEQGWVHDLSSATVFTKEEIDNSNMPNGASYIFNAAKYLDNKIDLYWYDADDAPRRVLTDPEAVEAAKEEYHRGGEVEVDNIEIDGGVSKPGDYTSRGDDPGCYVKAWVWVRFPDEYLTPIDEEE